MSTFQTICELFRVKDHFFGTYFCISQSLLVNAWHAAIVGQRVFK